eukprot:GDKJ01047648.1.p1 GENE.GDKJ01047648.1~~GDKJ01047648.1.p1  ORF type:complete len:174 (-),score=36.94 GDKJ01047648.1:38-559(-)
MLAIKRAFCTLDWSNEIDSFENDIRNVQRELDSAFIFQLKRSQAEYQKRNKIVSEEDQNIDSIGKMDKRSVEPIEYLELKDDYTDELMEFPIYNQKDAGIEDPDFQAALLEVPQYRQVDDDCPTEDAVREWATNMTAQYMTTVVDLFKSSFTDDNVKERMSKLRRQYMLYLKK